MQAASKTALEIRHGKGERWKQELSDSITSIAELLSFLGIEDDVSHQVLPRPDFRLKVTKNFAAKMSRGDLDDPLLKQVLPIVDETRDCGLIDPVGDMHAMPTSGLHHKYHGRCLLIMTGACAIHCRYCFRRHYPYENSNSKARHLDNTLDYLRSHRDIKEVILSGGDPLLLDDERLQHTISQLETIDHIRWLRIHSRLPVVLPSRITDALLGCIAGSRLRFSFVIHCNHANELGDAEARALQRLSDHGVQLLNQSVLLRGVNDTPEALIGLSEKLYDCGVLPYYLHCLDPVRGAMHFDVPIRDAAALIEGMRARLPGYLVPQLVKEEQGKPCKTAIFSI